MKTQRRIIFTCSAICVCSLVLFLSTLSPIPPLSDNAANDLLLGIFSGALVAIPVAYIEYRERLHELDQQFFPCAAELLNTVAGICEITDGEPFSNNLLIELLESLERRRYLHAFSPQGDADHINSGPELRRLLPDCDENAAREVALRAVKCKIFELDRSSWAYLKLRDYHYQKLNSLGRTYSYMLCRFSARQRQVNKLLDQAETIREKTELHASDIGNICIFKNCEYKDVLEQFEDIQSIVDYAHEHGCSLSVVLRSAVSLQNAWISPARADRQHERNKAATAFFQLFSLLASSSSWLEKGGVPSEPWW